ALDAAGAPADLVAAESDAGGLAQALADRNVAGATVWFPSAEGASSVLPDGLIAAGAHVDVQVLYRSVMPGDAPRRLAAALERPLDAVTLTSGSTARNLVAALHGRMLPTGTVVVCIGTHTAAAARAAGLAVNAVAGEPNAAGMVAALLRALAGPAPGDC
ncbi:MAG: uroporphyrinogen-III synthase, partial [Candidatus Dormibacteria bacterium]